MVKAAKAKTTKKAPTHTELRRWCIEMALRWPDDRMSMAATQYGHMPRAEVDVLSRAKRILDWVVQS